MFLLQKELIASGIYIPERFPCFLYQGGFFFFFSFLFFFFFLICHSLRSNLESLFDVEWSVAFSEPSFRYVCILVRLCLSDCRTLVFRPQLPARVRKMIGRMTAETKG
ncbi:hypothetical protein I7I52_12713 [Histoplasma capsulatum]|uniref:Uncharacterized protein n=1 Tax=Ajellomyces capsulatus TaxID=5037 RepID=A0A8H8CRC0_AJECA|nr:hypothetical protein I7I52_12713 [Histoplasma capsulatum]